MQRREGRSIKTHTMRNIGKHNNCNDETREKLEPRLPERQKEHVKQEMKRHP